MAKPCPLPQFQSKIWSWPHPQLVFQREVSLWFAWEENLSPGKSKGRPREGGSIPRIEHFQSESSRFSGCGTSSTCAFQVAVGVLTPHSLHYPAKGLEHRLPQGYHPKKLGLQPLPCVWHVGLLRFCWGLCVIFGVSAHCFSVVFQCSSTKLQGTKPDIFIRPQLRILCILDRTRGFAKEVLMKPLNGCQHRCITKWKLENSIYKASQKLAEFFVLGTSVIWIFKDLSRNLPLLVCPQKKASCNGTSSTTTQNFLAKSFY